MKVKPLLLLLLLLLQPQWHHFSFSSFSLLIIYLEACLHNEYGSVGEILVCVCVGGGGVTSLCV